ncbi:MAG: hypothetical protein V3V24_09770 [Nitrospinaceae bacterium]
MGETKLVLCKECALYEFSDGHKCTRLNPLHQEICFATGDKIAVLSRDFDTWVNCQDERRSTNFDTCGPDAKHFKELVK